MIGNYDALTHNIYNSNPVSIKNEQLKTKVTTRAGSTSNDGNAVNECDDVLYYLAMGRLFLVKSMRWTANGMEHTASTFTTLKAENLT